MLLASVGQSTAAPGKRVALVIGNGAYRHQPALNSPAQDARAMAAQLRKLGFDVEPAIDKNRLGMERAVVNFYKKLHGAELGLLFYSGHGIQLRDESFLIPVDAKLDDQDMVSFQTVAVQPILDRLQESAKVAVIILDACRDNPFLRQMKGGDKSVPKGIEVVRVAKKGDVAILYATSPAGGTWGQRRMETIPPAPG